MVESVSASSKGIPIFGAVLSSNSHSLVIKRNFRNISRIFFALSRHSLHLLDPEERDEREGAEERTLRFASSSFSQYWGRENANL